MGNFLRCVFDTNVIISAALFEYSKPAQALEKVFAIGELLFSEATENELEDTFFRKKFDPYLTVEERTEFLHYFLQQSVKIQITRSVSICRDPKDNMILELAVSGQADVIVTGDKDLLDLEHFEGISILSPKGFLETF
ncbi:MAG: putative toxin-antitoxin system toxin component, PIN family [Deltaproteobacteria bacterium]|nr:putative toxin-antitoxin system toxin component, PIN family [Deltaproteobacteria bacterium]